MAVQTVAQNSEELTQLLARQNQCVESVIALVQKAMKTTESLKTVKGVSDDTISAVVDKLSNSVKALTPVPDQLTELNRILQEKATALEDEVSSAVNTISNL